MTDDKGQQIMKIVINACYGGFSLSTEAVKDLIKRNCAAIKTDTFDESITAKAMLEDVGDGYQSMWGIEYVLMKDGVVYRYDNNNRTDPMLIALVEEWGGQRASSDVAALKVVEVPDGISYEIDDYDGYESIHETHRTWG